MEAGDGGGVERCDSPMLPKMIRLGSDAGEDMTSWYAETFSSEISEVKKSMKKANNLRNSLGGVTDDGVESDADESADLGAAGGDTESSISSSIATKLEIALMEANQQAESHLQEKELLENRLACLEELDELRMKLTTFEVQELLEQKSRDTAASRSPQWDLDHEHTNCWRCNGAFSLINRRHHCRKCGKIYCESCAPKNNVAPIPQFGFTKPVRHCLNCLPPKQAKKDTQAASRGLSSSTDDEDDFRISSANKRPFSTAIDGIRRMENNCLKNPSSENLLTTLQAYVRAIEKIANTNNILPASLRRESRDVVLRAMHAFIRMPQVASLLQDGLDKKAHEMISGVIVRQDSP